MPVDAPARPVPVSARRTLDLATMVLPAAPGTLVRLDTGANVLFAGCRSSHALTSMARQFPRSRFLATESSAEVLEAATDAVSIAGLQNTQVVRPNTLKQARLQGIFEFIIRQGGERAAPMAALAGLLREGGLVFDLGRELPSPLAYHEAGLVILRSIRLADGCACVIAGSWGLASRGV